MSAPQGTAPVEAWFGWSPREQEETARRRLPRLLAGRRRGRLALLIANGAGQFGVAVAAAFAVIGMGARTTPGAELVLMLGVLAAGQIGLRMLELGQAERFGQEFVQEARIALLKSAIRSVRTPDHGVTMTRLVNDLASLKNWVSLGVARSIVALLSLAGCVAAAALINAKLAMAIAIPVVVVLGLVLILARPIAARTRDARRARGRMASLLGEIMLDRDAISDRSTEKSILRRVAKRSLRMVDALVRRMRLVGLLRAAPEAAAPLTVLGFLAVEAELSGANMLGAFLLAMLVGAPLRILARAVEYRTSYVEARRRIESALNAPRRRRSPLSEGRSRLVQSAEAAAPAD